MSIEGIQADEIDNFWEKVAPLVERAMEYADGKMNTEDVYNGLKSKDFQLWLVPGGIWVTHIAKYPQSKRVEWIAAAGEYQDWTEHLPVLLDWARAQGCDAVEIGGRAGWGRKVGPPFEEIHRVFRASL